MPNDILHRFLNNRLFNIGDDDDRLTRLRTAAAALAEYIAGRREEVPRFAMVAFDPKVSPNDPVLDRVAEAVSDAWTTYTGVFADRPVVLLRAVLLDALRIVQDADENTAASIGLTARNLLPHMDLGNEKPIWLDLTEISEQALADGATSHWSVDIDDGSDGTVIPEATKPPKIDRKRLLAKIEAASGPQNEKGETLAGANTHWTNVGNPWSFMFSPRITNAIGDALDGAIENILAARAASDESLYAAMNSFVTDRMPGFLRAGRAMQQRGDLLWWRQSMYSNAAGTSYRTMKPESAAVQMAVDLFLTTPPYSPRSVEYFLREAVADAVGDGKGRSGSLTLKQVATSKTVRSEVNFSRLPFALTEGPGRRPLFNVLLGSGDVQDAVGIPDHTKLTLDELAVWLLRELQAAALVRLPESS